VICGHADLVHFATDLEMDDRFFAEVDRVKLDQNPAGKRVWLPSATPAQ
jgi:hypothetical protein